jgi:hypothetical protein
MPTKTSGNASVKWGATAAAITDVANATVTVSQASIDTTTVNGTFMSYTSGIVEGSADVELFLTSTHTVADLTPGATIANFELAITNGRNFKFPSAIVENVRTSVAPNGVVQTNMTVRNTAGAVVIS